ncbi:MAG TPA: thiamine-phosphate kinase [Ktedonobacterales bacterium]|nr:thiamine-phosphate kinase [Ktedonobacterales bacterium]
MRLDDLGEFPLIERLTAGLESRADVALGVGDDAAALDLGHDLGADHLLLATCDAQVEGTHFLTSVATPEEIGHKALAVNLSDIAAMGGEPLWALVSLLAPPDLEVTTLDGVYTGMRALARRFNVALVGGNVSSTPGPLTLDVTALGRVSRQRLVTRAGARPGDRLLVTGRLGAAVAALLAFTAAPPDAAIPTEALAEARRAMVTPQPRVREGMALAATGQVTAMLDISDGLAGDLGHICQRSGVGAIIELAALPVDASTRALALALGRDPLRLALTSGDDYELLCAVRPEGVAAALEAVRAVGGSATIIGEITAPEEGLRVRAQNGALLAVDARGWDHLRPHDQPPDAKTDMGEQSAGSGARS